MYKYKRIICIGLTFILSATVTMAYAAKKEDNKVSEIDFVVPDSSALDVTSVRYTQIEEVRKVKNRLADLKGFEKKMESDILAVYYSDETKGIRILNKETGYVWGGLKETKAEDMNKKWSSMANSIISIDYLGGNCQSARATLGDSGNSLNFNWKENEAICNANFVLAGISLSFKMKLEEDHLTIEVLQNTVKELKNNKLQSVWILPFLGTVKEDTTPGYMFVPDGSGALIRYNKKGTYTSVYDERVYGKDASVDGLSEAGDLIAKRNNDYMIDTPKATIPVYGVVHGANQNAYMAVIEEGAEYSSVYASPAGMVTDYNWVSSRFDYRQAYSYPVNKSGKTIMTTQDEAEAYNGRVTFYFLSNEKADYSGMAVKYRELVKNAGILKRNEREDKEIPMYLHMMAGVVEEGLIFNGYNKLTSVKEAQDIVDNLRRNDIKNISVSYEGWQKNGISGHKYGTTSLDSDLGNEGDLKELHKMLGDNGGRFYLYTNPVSFNEDQARIASTSALTISKNYSSYTRSNTMLMYPTEYYAHPSDVVDSLADMVEDYPEYNLDVAKVGNMIYGDYSKNEKISRQKSKQILSETVSKIKKDKVLENPNQYLWNDTSEYINMPLQNSQYMYETDSVPFLQIVLKGSIDYYAPYANQGFYNQTNKLKMIEYGAYPSFIIMSEKNEKLIDTPLEDYFSLNYNDWSDVMKEVYQYLNGALKEVEGSSIIQHKMLDTGVAAVSYDNGKVIYINYLNREYVTKQGVHIPAKNYLVADR